MDKKSFLNSINSEDKLQLAKLYDDIILAERCGATIFSKEMYTPNLWKAIVTLGFNFNICIDSYGIFDESERRMLAFNSQGELSYPLNLIYIKNKSKFKNLQHKDYLGAIMSLGIIREKIGDLVVLGEGAYVAVCSDIASYILSNLKAIGKCPCDIEVLDGSKDNFPGVNLEEIHIISTSMRLDCVVGAILGISRSKSTELIQKGKVLVDYVENLTKDKDVLENSIITIRGFGKYKFSHVEGETGKGRMKLVILKYV